MIVLALLGQACGGPLRYAVQGTPRAAGADATVEASVSTEQSTTRLEVQATNLPPPDRIQAGAASFVVWQRRNQGASWTRVGALQYNPSTRVGEMHNTTVPETAFEMQITAETTPAPATPSAHVVFLQRVGE